VTNTLEEERIAYLLLELYPAITNSIEHKLEIKHIKKTLYSTSHIARLGPQSILAQNK